MPRKEITESYGNTNTFLWNISHSFAQIWTWQHFYCCESVPSLPYPCQLVSLLFNICHSHQHNIFLSFWFVISSVINDDKHIFIYILAVCMSSSGKCLFLKGPFQTTSIIMNLSKTFTKILPCWMWRRHVLWEHRFQWGIWYIQKFLHKQNNLDKCTENDTVKECNLSGIYMSLNRQYIV